MEDTLGAVDETAQETVHKLLDLPESYLCHCLIALGIPEDADQLEPVERTLSWEHVYVGHYSTEEEKE